MAQRAIFRMRGFPDRFTFPASLAQLGWQVILNEMKYFLRLPGRRKKAEGLYAALVVRAREPVFYLGFGVADTRDGRFDLLALHAWLVLERTEGVLKKRLVEAIFTGFTDALRAGGAEDIGLARHLKRMAEAFYGRLAAYGGAVGEAALAAALERNLYRGAAGRAETARALARYALNAREKLSGWQPEREPLDFGPLPG
jgi:cytochrome b pre-mRNA-processing protein 3